MKVKVKGYCFGFGAVNDLLGLRLNIFVIESVPRCLVPFSQNMMNLIRMTVVYDASPPN